jgi:hypothetical protein
MKTTALLFSGLLVAFLLVNYSLGSRNWLDLGAGFPSETDTELNERNQMFREWVHSAEEIVGATQDPTARNVLEFVKSSALMASPARIGAKYLEGGRDGITTHLGVVMLRPGDESAGPEWSNHTSSESNAGAHFQPNGPMMVIKSNIEFSRFAQGIVLLHEGRHAQRFLTTHYDWEQARAFCEEERDTHEFQNRITAEKLGTSYTVLVEKLAQEMKGVLAQAGYRPGEATAPRKRNFSEFDELWPPASEHERDFRDTSVWIHANFLLLDEAFKVSGEFNQGAADQKALFLFSRYEELGILGDSQ